MCRESLLKHSAFALRSDREVLIPWAPVCSLAAGAAVGLRAEPCGAGWAVQAVELWGSVEVILLSLQQILHSKNWKHWMHCAKTVPAVGVLGMP